MLQTRLVTKSSDATNAVSGNEIHDRIDGTLNIQKPLK
jgi:hypothetical protein